MLFSDGRRLSQLTPWDAGLCPGWGAPWVRDGVQPSPPSVPLKIRFDRCGPGSRGARPGTGKVDEKK